MTNEQAAVRDWMKAFGQECPEKPIVPSLEVKELRAKLILEEALETIHALGFSLTFSTNNYGQRTYYTEQSGFEPNLELIADGCSDLKVVTEGTLVACGLIDVKTNHIGLHSGIDPLFDEVMRSNFSKMWNDDDDKYNPELTYTKVADHPEVDVSYYIARDKDGKVIKSPSYSPANLQPIIEEMSKT